MNEKILHLRSSGGLYGAEQVILNLARELNTLGCTNHIVCFNNITQDPHLELVDEARRANLSAFAVDCRGALDRQTVKGIREIIRSKDIDVIHCHDYKACAFGLSRGERAEAKNGRHQSFVDPLQSEASVL